MDIGAEISKKIQMAITAKLKELDAYVDDELPDYIMIMVANKKTEEQMTDALSLFLSSNTKTFTSWLHNLLSSLRKGKVDKSQTVKESNSIEKVYEEKSQRRSSTDKASRPVKPQEQHKTDTVKQSSNFKPQSEAIITIENNEMHELFDEELIAESSAAEVMSLEVQADMPKSSKLVSHCDPNSESQVTKTKLSKADKSLKRKSSDPSTSESIKAKNGRPQKLNSDKLDHRKNKTSKDPSLKRSRSSSTASEKSVREWDRGKGKDFDEIRASANYRKHGQNRDHSFYSDSESDDETIKKGRVSSTVNQMMQNAEFVSESDSEEDSKSKVSSRVTYPKRTMRVPLNKQANKALFMKAVNAAEKSVKISRVTSSNTSVEIDETEAKPSASRKNKQLVRAGKRQYAENDARRKLQIKKAISEAFQSQLVASSKRGKAKIIDRHTSSESPNHFDSQESQSQDLKSIKRAKVTDKMAKAPNQSPPESYPQSDQRKFIIQTKRTQINTPAVAFDSREALPRTLQKDANPSVKTLPSLSISNIDPINKTLPSNYTPPNFIVTMDGVIRSKHKSQLSEDERKAARIKKFKSETDADSAKALLTKLEKPSSAMQELEKMKNKILQVERESSKLKQMQIKLAAVQNGTKAPSGNEQRSISVANVHYSTTEKQLSDYFSICGKVVRSTILRDIATGHPKGFAYLEFEDTSAVTSALALNNTQLNNRAIRVTVKQPSAPNTSYQSYRGYPRPFRSRLPRGFSPQGRFTRFGAHKVITRNKTWVNPTISGINKS